MTNITTELHNPNDQTEIPDIEKKNNQTDIQETLKRLEANTQKTRKFTKLIAIWIVLGMLGSVSTFVSYYVTKNAHKESLREITAYECDQERYHGCCEILKNK